MLALGTCLGVGAVRVPAFLVVAGAQLLALGHGAAACADGNYYGKRGLGKSTKSKVC